MVDKRHRDESESRSDNSSGLHAERAGAGFEVLSSASQAAAGNACATADLTYETWRHLRQRHSSDLARRLHQKPGKQRRPSNLARNIAREIRLEFGR